MALTPTKALNFVPSGLKNQVKSDESQNFLIYNLNKKDGRISRISEYSFKSHFILFKTTPNFSLRK
jgi:hypothetical protein